MSLEDFDNIVAPSAPGGSSCGYCGPPGQRSEKKTNHQSAALVAHKLSCSVYQRMIGRGWRRSGGYCYKPDLKISCCPQYTIKLDAMAFKPSRSQRKIINRWNRFILYGESDGEAMNTDQSGPSASATKSRVKPTKSAPFTSLSAAIHESEVGFTTEEKPAHKFEVVLEPASYTAEKFALYKKYQLGIHKDQKNTQSGFKRFLVDSPLNIEPIPYSSPPPSHLPFNYGSYHQLYKLDDELIAVGVLDILPNCVSSVYFMYDNNWERFSLGKLSALREVSLAQEIREAGAPEMQSLYMGFYIHSCQKMRYKGEYAPSCLADSETYEWYPLEVCTPLLEKYRYACFSQSSHSTNDKASVKEPKPVLLSTDAEEFDGVKILCRAQNGDIIAVPIKDTGYLSYPKVRQEMGACIQGLGHALSTEVYFTP